MRRTGKIVVALIMMLTLIIGSVGMVSAGSTKIPTLEAEITKVVGQSIYYSIKWTNQDPPVLSYYVEVSYQYAPDNFICLVSETGDNPVIVNLNRAKSRLGIRGTFNSIDPTYTIQPGDTIKIYVIPFSGANGTGDALGYETVTYLVP